MGKLIWLLLVLTIVDLCLVFPFSAAQLRRNYYADTCPEVESIVRSSVTQKFKETFVTIPGTIRLFFHDCMVEGCDASIMIVSTPDNTAEKDETDHNLSIAGDGFDTVNRAKAAVDSVDHCKNKVSCADILAMAARDAIALSGGPSYAVELGRLDGLSSTAASVKGKLPDPSFDLEQLTSLFHEHGLSQSDMIALSGAHTVGFSHCNRFSNRIYNYTQRNQIDPSMNNEFAAQLRTQCPPGADPTIAINFDVATPRIFDNNYYKNLQKGMGLLNSDQVLYTDPSSRPVVNKLASSSAAFEKAFVAAITNLGRVGVKTGINGNVRRNCAVFN